VKSRRFFQKNEIDRAYKSSPRQFAGGFSGAQIQIRSGAASLGRDAEKSGDALPLFAFFLGFTAYCADGAVAARLSCHGEPPSRKIETC